MKPGIYWIYGADGVTIRYVGESSDPGRRIDDIMFYLTEANRILEQMIKREEHASSPPGDRRISSHCTHYVSARRSGDWRPKRAFHD